MSDSSANDDSSVIMETRGGVLFLTLNRPQTGNTVNLKMARALLAAATVCGKDPTIRAVVLSGTGRHFCLGGDLRGMAANEAESTLDSHLRELTTCFHSALSLFVRLPVPIIAAVNGTAAGAGVGLVAMADLALCGAGATFNLAYTGVGLTPDAGTSFLLPRSIGVKRTMELILLNRPLAAVEALSWGLVNRVVEDSQLLAQASGLAQQLCRGPVGAFGKAKGLVAQSLAEFDAHLQLESETIASQSITAEGREGIAAFVQKRAPVFT